MSRSLLLVCCLVIGLLILACGGPTNKNGTPTNSSSGESVAASPAATVAAADQIGVPECDNFLNAYETCVTTKVPAAVRPGFTATMTTWRSEWKRMAADPRDGLGADLRHIVQQRDGCDEVVGAQAHLHGAGRIGTGGDGAAEREDMDTWFAHHFSFSDWKKRLASGPLTLALPKRRLLARRRSRSQRFFRRIWSVVSTASTFGTPSSGPRSSWR